MPFNVSKKVDQEGEGFGENEKMRLVILLT
jgi:hypothetical protein